MKYQAASQSPKHGAWLAAWWVLPALLLGWWFTVAPTQFSGLNTYVVVDGHSMEPLLFTGDLAVARAKNSYGVGDLVVYRVDYGYVIHRIIDGSQDSGWRTQGDNRLKPDEWVVADSDILGTYRFRIAGFQKSRGWVGRHTIALSAAVAAFVLVVLGDEGRLSRRRRGRTMGSPKTRAVRNTLSDRVNPTFQVIAWIAFAVIVFAASLGGLSWMAPSLKAASNATGGSQRLEFAYFAKVPESAAYQNKVVSAPDPVFRKLANKIDVTYNYQGQPGTIAVAADLSTSSGWHWTVPLAAPTPFTGDTATGKVTLDLAQLQSLADAGAEATGIPAGDIAVNVVPTVETSAGKFEPELKLILSPLSLKLASSEDPEKSLVVTDSQSGTTTRMVPNKINLLFLSIPVSLARIASVVLLLVGLLIGLGVLIMVRRSPVPTQAERIRNRYKSLIVDVEPIPAPTGTVIDVPDIETLTRLATRYGLLVLHWSEEFPGGATDIYVVQDDKTTYRTMLHPVPELEHEPGEWGPRHARRHPMAGEAPDGDPLDAEPPAAPAPTPPGDEAWPKPEGATQAATEDPIREPTPWA